MVLPYFDYGDLIYAAANMCLLDKLQRLQNKALRIIGYYNPLMSINQLHLNNKLPYLVDRRQAHMLNCMYKRSPQPKFIKKTNLLTRAYDKKILVVYQPKTEKAKS